MVSIHRVPAIVYLIIRVICFIFRFKRGTVCPHLQGEGRQNYPNDKDGFEQFHAMIREAAMSSSIIRV